MTAIERDIYYYLKSRRREHLSVREIGRRAGGKRRFRATPDWAKPILADMADRGIVESDAEGRYRLKPLPGIATKGKRWASPRIVDILKASGKQFSSIMTSDEEDEYYLNL